jgi:hypothetical protein
MALFSTLSRNPVALSSSILARRSGWFMREEPVRASRAWRYMALSRRKRNKGGKSAAVSPFPGVFGEGGAWPLARTAIALLYGEA